MIATLLQDAYGRFGLLVALLPCVMIVATLLEGFGLTLLLPLLSSFGLGDSAQGESGTLSRLLETLLGPLGVLGSLPGTIGLIVTVMVAQTLVSFGAKALEGYVSTAYTADWRRRLYAGVIHSNWSFLQRTPVEEQTNQILIESSRCAAALSLCFQIINAVFLSLTYAAISLVAAWEIVVALILLGGTIYFLTRRLSNRSHAIGKQVTEVNKVLFGRVQEFMMNAKLIKSTATEEASQDIVFADLEENRKVFFRAGLQPQIITTIYMLAGYCALGASVYVAVTQFSISPAETVLAMYVFLRLYTQIVNIQQLRQSLILSYPALENCRSALSSAGENREQPTGQRRRKLTLESSDHALIRVRDVDVNYEDIRALKGVSLDIAHGAVVGLTGASGSGKSTLVDTIVGLLTPQKGPQKGEVLIDGIDLQEIVPEDWRRRIGYVSQQTLLIQGTIAENIAWGQNEVTRSEIEAAARAAYAHDFIMKMQDGYETDVGRRSVALSGGQLQRLGIARAILGDRTLLILDEATSALDSENEARLLETVAGLRRKFTVIMIAHRLSTLRMCDKIIVMDEGQIREEGSFTELLELGGAFADLWSIQSRASQ